MLAPPGLACRLGRWSPVATVQRRPKWQRRPVRGSGDQGVGTANPAHPAGETVGPRKPPPGARKRGSGKLPFRGRCGGEKGAKTRAGLARIFASPTDRYVMPSKGARPLKSRRAKPKGIFTPCAGTRPGAHGAEGSSCLARARAPAGEAQRNYHAPSGCGPGLRGSSLFWG